MRLLKLVIIFGLLFSLTAGAYGVTNDNFLGDDEFWIYYGADTPELRSLAKKKENNNEYGITRKDFARYYTQRSPSKMPYQKDPIIPKIMHQIWIGSNPLPHLYENYFQECKMLHPDWELKFWDEESIKEFYQKYPEYKNLYDLAKNPVHKSDIFRYSVLLEEGGVYRDTDVKCYRSFDEYNHKYDFYAVAEFIPCLNNGLIGSVPKHPIIDDVLHSLDINFLEQMRLFDLGDMSQLSSGRFDLKLDYGINTIHVLSLVTTMIPLTKSFTKFADSTQSIALPLTYVFPFDIQDEYQNYDLYGRLQTFKDKAFFRLLKSIFLKKICMCSVKKPGDKITNRTFAFHDLKKGMMDIDFNHAMDFVSRKHIYKNLKIEESRKLNKMKENYDNFHFKKIPFSVKDGIPQRMVFVVFNEDEKKELESNLPDWKLHNALFEVQIWNQKDILEIAPRLQSYFANLNNDNIDEIRFIAGLEIINQIGGHYIDYRAKPINSIFEPGNKYKMYAGLQPINPQNKRVLMSNRILGSAQSSPILTEALDGFYNEGSEVRSALPYIISKNMYTYKPVLVLPSAYVGPADGYYGQNDSYFSIIRRSLKKCERSTINERHGNWALIE